MRALIIDPHTGREALGELELKFIGFESQAVLRFACGCRAELAPDVEVFELRPKLRRKDRNTTSQKRKQKKKSKAFQVVKAFGL